MTTASSQAGSRSCDARSLGSADRRAPLLSVIVPAYNESATISQLLSRVADAEPRDKEIIVVDDGSSDGTYTHLQEWRADTSAIVLRHDVNRGKGAAIRTGLQHATGRYVIIQDADLEYDPADYIMLLEPLIAGRSLVVYGSRYQPSSALLGRPSVWFRSGVSLLNVATWILYGCRLTDEATCYKAMDRRLLERMDLQCERFEFCPEVTAKACRLGARILEVPIRYSPRDAKAGKKICLSDGFAALRELWKWRNWIPERVADCEVTPGNQVEEALLDLQSRRGDTRDDSQGFTRSDPSHGTTQSLTPTRTSVGRRPR
jgi:dolichol-phosphate mannosyltransferase